MHRNIYLLLNFYSFYLLWIREIYRMIMNNPHITIQGRTIALRPRRRCSRNLWFRNRRPIFGPSSRSSSSTSGTRPWSLFRWRSRRPSCRRRWGRRSPRPPPATSWQCGRDPSTLQSGEVCRQGDFLSEIVRRKFTNSKSKIFRNDFRKLTVPIQYFFIHGIEWDCYGLKPI